MALQVLACQNVLLSLTVLCMWRQVAAVLGSV